MKKNKKEESLEIKVENIVYTEKGIKKLRKDNNYVNVYITNFKDEEDFLDKLELLCLIDNDKFDKNTINYYKTPFIKYNNRFKACDKLPLDEKYILLNSNQVYYDYKLQFAMRDYREKEAREYKKCEKKAEIRLKKKHLELEKICGDLTDYVIDYFREYTVIDYDKGIKCDNCPFNNTCEFYLFDDYDYEHSEKCFKYQFNEDMPIIKKVNISFMEKMYLKRTEKEKFQNDLDNRDKDSLFKEYTNRYIKPIHKLFKENDNLYELLCEYF